MLKPRVLFLTDRGERHQKHALKFAPPELDVIIKRRPAPSELNDLLTTADFIISERSEPVTADMIVASPDLQLIVRLGSLLVGIDTNAAAATSVRVSLQPVMGSIYVAEHVLMMTLAALKHLGRSLWQANSADHGMAARRTDENTFAFNWLGLTDLNGLYGKTISILGMGEIGVEFTRRVRPFRPAAIQYYKRNRYPASIESELGITYGDLVTCLRNADVVISLLPFALDTDRSIHGGTFETMKPGAVLIHAGSGSVIDEQALITALKSGKLAGAALDTYEYEPLAPTHSLVALARDPKSNLLLTPHTAGASLPESRAEDFSEIVRFLHREPLRHAVR